MSSHSVKKTKYLDFTAKSFFALKGGYEAVIKIRRSTVNHRLKIKAHCLPEDSDFVAFTCYETTPSINHTSLSMVLDAWTIIPLSLSNVQSLLQFAFQRLDSQF